MQLRETFSKPMKPKSDPVKEKFDCYTCINMKHFCTSKHIIKNIKANGKWEKICQYINKGLLFLIFEEVFCISKKKTNISKKIRERI